MYVNKKRINIVAVNETRLDDYISSGEVRLPGYILERNDREKIRDGGQTALFIRDTINYERQVKPLIFPTLMSVSMITLSLLTVALRLERLSVVLHNI